MKKKIAGIALSCVLIAALVLTSCGPKTTTTTSAAATTTTTTTAAATTTTTSSTTGTTGSSVRPAIPTGWVDYVNATYGLSVAHPARYVAGELPSTFCLVKLGDAGTNYLPNVTVGVVDATAATNAKDAFSAFLVGETKTVGADFAVTPITIHTQACWISTGSWGGGYGTYDGKVIITQKNNKWICILVNNNPTYGAWGSPTEMQQIIDTIWFD